MWLHGGVLYCSKDCAGGGGIPFFAVKRDYPCGTRIKDLKSTNHKCLHAITEQLQVMIYFQQAIEHKSYTPKQGFNPRVWYITKSTGQMICSTPSGAIYNLTWNIKAKPRTSKQPTTSIRTSKKVVQDIHGTNDHIS